MNVHYICEARAFVKSAKKWGLLDHLVGLRKDRERDRDAQRRCRLEARLSPDFARGLDDEAELGLLLFHCQRIAVDGRGEAALRAEAELVERHVFGRFVDAALQFVLALERGAL